MANALVDTLIFTGSIAGQSAIQSQPLGGNFTIQLPNVPPIVGQLMTATALNNSTVVLGWSSAQSTASPTFTGTVTASAIAAPALSSITISASGGAVVVSSPLKLSQSLIVPAAGQDVAGTATLTNPATTVAVVFNTHFLGTQAPVVVITALNANPVALGGVWITNQGSSGNWTGFTINVATTPASSIIFNYHTIGS